MLTRFKNIWRPQNFHLQHRVGGGVSCFEGWYFKLVNGAGEGPRAVIPGVFLGDDAHAFIQLLDGAEGSSTYHRFPLGEFRADADCFDVSIGRSRFNCGGMDLDIDADETEVKQAVYGGISFSDWNGWPVTLGSPGVMGPYSFAPFMECNHGILSMDHSLSGTLTVDEETVSYDNGRGYIEKDWGRSFPRGYVWAQSNHFEEDGVSISASVARIPWISGSFPGFLVGLLLRGRLYRFTTYTGARIEQLSVDDHSYRLVVQDREHRLEINATRSEGGLLHAPYNKRMIERVAETMTSQIDIRLERRADGSLVYEGRGEHGCLEVQGELGSILHD
ncbi:MAG: tocopherol cyclase family protein [Halioglobus sp.]